VFAFSVLCLCDAGQFSITALFTLGMFAIDLAGMIRNSRNSSVRSFCVFDAFDDGNTEIAQKMVDTAAAALGINIVII
jgi:hypothetical protein